MAARGARSTLVGVTDAPRPLIPRPLAAVPATAVLATAALLVASGCTVTAKVPTGAVAGSVLSPSGGGSTCANCLRPDPSRLQFVAGGTVRRTISTDARGRFRARLRPGSYLVRVIPLFGEAPPPSPVLVRAGATAHLRLICSVVVG